VQKNINVAEFLSVCIFLSEECGKVIRTVHESGVLQTEAKGVENPVTVADFRVQKTIVSCLHQLYPSLRVVGEEDDEKIAHFESAVDPKSITHAVKSFIKTDMLNDMHE